MESIKRYQQELPKKIAEITAQYNKYIQDFSNERLALEVQLSELKELNLDSLLSEYETQGDKMVKVLYGSNK
jgi:phage host-nuclease inhibitor protein Gam